MIYSINRNIWLWSFFCLPVLDCVVGNNSLTMSKKIFGSYSVNISQKQSKDEESGLMWGTAQHFTCAPGALKWCISALTSRLLSCHNWYFGTLLSESSDKLSAVSTSESSETRCSSESGHKSTLQSDSQQPNAHIFPWR